jgi:adenylosuccinate synthase
VFVHLPGLFAEIEKSAEAVVGWENRLIISDRAHLVFDMHQMVDGMQESERADNKLGTTKKGIGPTYSTKHWRSGLRVADLIGDFDDFSSKFKTLVNTYSKQFPSLKVDVEKELDIYKNYATKLKSLGIVTDTVSYLRHALQSVPAKNILIEGANGALLDIDFGTYPFVTSSNCSVGGALTGLGIPPRCLGEIIGIVKAYQTRVGDGPFPTELTDEIGEELRKIGREYGVTTGRPRRCGWLDLVLLKYTNDINGYTSLALTKIDIMDTFKEIKIAVGYKLDGKEIDYMPANLKDFGRVEVIYEILPGWMSDTSKIRQFADLPENARFYVEKIEEIVGVHIRWIGIGQDRKALICR